MSPPSVEKQMCFVLSFFNALYHAAGLEGQRECGFHRGVMVVHSFSVLLSHNFRTTLCESSFNLATVWEPLLAYT